jgi:hypothetical protein
MSKLFALGICLLAIAAARSSATVVYNNGPSNLSDGANITSYAVADDFTISSPTNIKQITIWSSSDTDPYPEFTNLIDWAILRDNSGTPGAGVLAGSSLASFENTGAQILGTEEFQLNISLPDEASTVLLIPGTYWLALEVDPSGTLSQQVYWDATSDQHGSPAMSTADTSLQSGWAPALSGEYGTDVAFTLSGEPTNVGTAPEVGTFGFSSMALCALLLLTRFSAKGDRSN